MYVGYRSGIDGDGRSLIINITPCINFENFHCSIIGTTTLHSVSCIDSSVQLTNNVFKLSSDSAHIYSDESGILGDSTQQKACRVYL